VASYELLREGSIEPGAWLSSSQNDSGFEQANVYLNQLGGGVFPVSCDI
jgi:hypothetical protein